MRAFTYASVPPAATSAARRSGDSESHCAYSSRSNGLKRSAPAPAPPPGTPGTRPVSRDASRIAAKQLLVDPVEQVGRLVAVEAADLVQPQVGPRREAGERGGLARGVVVAPAGAGGGEQPAAGEEHAQPQPPFGDRGLAPQRLEDREQRVDAAHGPLGRVQLRQLLAGVEHEHHRPVQLGQEADERRQHVDELGRLEQREPGSDGLRARFVGAADTLDEVLQRALLLGRGDVRGERVRELDQQLGGTLPREARIDVVEVDAGDGEVELRRQPPDEVADQHRLADSAHADQVQRPLVVVARGELPQLVLGVVALHVAGEEPRVRAPPVLEVHPPLAARDRGLQLSADQRHETLAGRDPVERRRLVARAAHLVAQPRGAAVARRLRRGQLRPVAQAGRKLLLEREQPLGDLARPVAHGPPAELGLDGLQHLLALQRWDPEAQLEAAAAADLLAPLAQAGRGRAVDEALRRLVSEREPAGLGERHRPLGQQHEPGGVLPAEAAEALGSRGVDLGAQLGRENSRVGLHHGPCCSFA